MADFYAVQAETKRCVLLDVPPATIYLVAAWDGVRGGWSIRRTTCYEEFLTHEAAEAFAAKLSACWLNRTIIEIRLSADSKEAVK